MVGLSGGGCETFGIWVVWVWALCVRVCVCVCFFLGGKGIVLSTLVRLFVREVSEKDTLTPVRVVG